MFIDTEAQPLDLDAKLARPRAVAGVFHSGIERSCRSSVFLVSGARGTSGVMIVSLVEVVLILHI